MRSKVVDDSISAAPPKAEPAARKKNTANQDNKDELHKWMKSVETDIKDLKSEVSLLNDSLISLTKAIISNEENNRSNINQLVDSISVLVKKIGGDIAESTGEVESDSDPEISKSSSKSTPKSNKRSRARRK